MAEQAKSAFEERLKGLEKEIRLHCYRLTGSLQDSEDMLQESLIRAWKKQESLRDGELLRPWLYRIATNVCLDHLKYQKRRQLAPVFLAASDPHKPFPPPASDVAWLDPFPDAWLPIEGTQPESKLIESENISLAFLASIQLLPPMQRAALILVDVLDWSAAETGKALGNSLSSVNNLLYRARKTLREKALQGKLSKPSASEEQALLRQYLDAWERSDADALSRLLTEDAIFHMPPFPAWYAGREAIGILVEGQLFDAGQPERWKLEATRANGQAAFRLLRLDESSGQYGPFGLMLLSFEESAIAEIGAFLNPQIMAHFQI